MIKLLLEQIVSFVSLIANLLALVELVITKADHHGKMRLASQSINGISRILQKLLNILTVQLF